MSRPPIYLYTSSPHLNKFLLLSKKNICWMFPFVISTQSLLHFLCSQKVDYNMFELCLFSLCSWSVCILFGLDRYNENIVLDPGIVDIYPSSRIPKNLHYLVKPIYRLGSSITEDLSRSNVTLKEKGFQITTDPQTVASILQLSSDDEVVSIWWFGSLPWYVDTRSKEYW